MQGSRDKAVNAWPYHVIHKHSSFAVHRVYYDEQGEIWTCSKEPAYPEGVSLEDLCEDLEMYQVALDLPGLEYSDLIPQDKPPSVVMAFCAVARSCV